MPPGIKQGNDKQKPIALYGSVSVCVCVGSVLGVGLRCNYDKQEEPELDVHSGATRFRPLRAFFQTCINMPPRGINMPPRGINMPPRGVNMPPRGINMPPRGHVGFRGCATAPDSSAGHIVAIFYPFSQFCEINISLPSP